VDPDGIFRRLGAAVLGVVAHHLRHAQAVPVRVAQALAASRRGGELEDDRDQR
jgi:hypothetical protein